MLPVRGHDGVVGPEGLEDPDGDRLLAHVEVEEAADLLTAAPLDAALLGPADGEHLVEQVQRVLALERRSVAQGDPSRVEVSPRRPARARGPGGGGA